MSHRLTEGHASDRPQAESRNFAFGGGVSVFKAEAAPDGKKRRIAGIISTDGIDRQNEKILQSGLDYSFFLSKGFFNWDHNNDADNIVGWPERVQKYDKGQSLPDGSSAQENCTWVEGYLLDTKKGDSIWELAQALSKSDRNLGYSIEGQIIERTGPNGSVIAKASVRNVALTAQPVNSQATLCLLARSLSAVEKLARKSMTLTDVQGSAGPVKPNKPYVQGNGQVMSAESLDRRRRLRRRRERTLSRSQAVDYVKSLMPGLSEALARAIVVQAESHPGRGV